LLTNEFQKEKELYKKLFSLIEDSFAFTVNENQTKRIEKLMVSFRNIGLECFLHFRQYTCKIVTLFPMKPEINEDLICLLPDDSFESFKNNEFTLKGQKVFACFILLIFNVWLLIELFQTLRQLIRLQISEFLKRLFFLFIRNYYEVTAKFDIDFYPYLQVNILNSMLTESQKRQKELLSVLYYHKSLHDQNLVLSEQITLDPKSPRNLWPVCRNIRKGLYSALTM